MNQRKSDNEAPAPRWRDYVPIHPAAELFPSLTNAELRELGEDIKANGLQHKVIVEPKDDGSLTLLDGRGRLDAMELVGIPVIQDGKLRPELYEEAPLSVEPERLVASLNIHRRHRTLEQKREAIERLLEVMPDASDRRIASITKTSHHTVAKVRGKMAEGGSTFEPEPDGRGHFAHVVEKSGVSANAPATTEMVGEAPVTSAAEPAAEPQPTLAAVDSATGEPIEIELVDKPVKPKSATRIDTKGRRQPAHKAKAAKAAPKDEMRAQQRDQALSAYAAVLHQNRDREYECLANAIADDAVGINQELSPTRQLRIVQKILEGFSKVRIADLYEADAQSLASTSSSDAHPACPVPDKEPLARLHE
jgi:hypothetical protein